jgi:hypothetical protein
MIFNRISYLDCFVFLVLLVPQLLLQVGPFEIAAWLLPAVPSLRMMFTIHSISFTSNSLKVFQIPCQLIRERCFVPREYRTPFVQRATVFQDLVIRCVRYAFAFLPAHIGRVFFSKAVVLPFLQFRMFRHRILLPSPAWYELNHVRHTYHRPKVIGSVANRCRMVSVGCG